MDNRKRGVQRPEKRGLRAVTQILQSVTCSNMQLLPMPADSAYDRSVGVPGKTCQGSIFQGQKGDHGFPWGVRPCHNDDYEVREN